MIPAGVKTTVKDVETIAPTRNPTAEENQEIRNLIKEAFVVRYGRENAELWLPTIDAPENLTLPVRVADLQHAFEKASEWMEQNAPRLQNDESFLAQYPKMHVDVAEALVGHPALAKSDEVIRQKDQASFEKAYENLDSPNKALGRAAWSAGETVARSAGVVGGTIAGVVLKAAAGGAVGAAEAAAPAVGAAFGLDDNETRAAILNSKVGFFFGAMAAVGAGASQAVPILAYLIGGEIWLVELFRLLLWLLLMPCDVLWTIMLLMKLLPIKRHVIFLSLHHRHPLRHPHRVQLLPLKKQKPMNAPSLQKH